MFQSLNMGLTTGIDETPHAMTLDILHHQVSYELENGSHVHRMFKERSENYFR